MKISDSLSSAWTSHARDDVQTVHPYQKLSPTTGKCTMAVAMQKEALNVASASGHRLLPQAL